MNLRIAVILFSVCLAGLCANKVAPPKLQDQEEKSPRYDASGRRVKTFDEASCKYEVTEKGVFTHDLIRRRYPRSMDCYWVITAPVDKMVQVEFKTFRVQYSPFCAKDAVTLFDGPRSDARIAKLCGARSSQDSYPDGPYRSSGRHMVLHFNTDNRIVQECQVFNPR